MDAQNHFKRGLVPTCIALTLVIASICRADDPQRPPPLTFDKHVDYLGWYDKFVSKGRAESDNANELYKKLEPDSDGKGGLQLPKGEVEKQLEHAIKRPWTAKEFPELKSFLDSSEPLVDQYRQATKRPYFWQSRSQKERTLIDVVLPSLAPCRAGCKTLIAQGWLKEVDQANRMLVNWRTIFANSRQFADQPILIGQLVANAERSFVYQQACRAVRDGVIKEANAAMALTVLRENGSNKLNLTEMVVMEWAFDLNALQLIAPNGEVDRGEWEKLYQMVGTWPSRPNKQQKSPPPDPVKTLQVIEDYFPKVRGIIKGPIKFKKLGSLRDLSRSYSVDRDDNAFLHVLLTDFSRAYELMLRTEIQRRAATLILAMHDYKLKNKKWPAKLDDLKIDDLKTLRTDPYSDKDFIYKLAEGEPLLYSIASDGKDDGGRHDPKWGESPGGGDYVFWPVQDDNSTTTQPHRGE